MKAEFRWPGPRDNLMKKYNTLSGLIQSIRGLITDTRKRAVLSNGPVSNWDQIYASLDVIEDTELAIDSFLKDRFPSSDGRRYLVLYGFLQAMFLQQDAVSHLLEAVGLRFKPQKPEDHPDLFQIREFRNLAIGHPTKKDVHKDKGKKTDATRHAFITRMSLSRDGFDLMVWNSTEGLEKDTPEFNLPVLVRTQKEQLLAQLVRLTEHIETIDQEHLREYAFPFFSLRIGQAAPTLYNSTIPIIGEGAGPVAEIQAATDAMEQELQRRGFDLETFESVKYTVTNLRMAAKLALLLAGDAKWGTPDPFGLDTWDDDEDDNNDDVANANANADPDAEDNYWDPVDTIREVVRHSLVTGAEELGNHRAYGTVPEAVAKLFQMDMGYQSRSSPGYLCPLLTKAREAVEPADPRSVDADLVSFLQSAAEAADLYQWSPFSSPPPHDLQKHVKGYLAHHWKDLVEMAREIDQDYILAAESFGESDLMSLLEDR